MDQHGDVEYTNEPAVFSISQSHYTDFFKPCSDGFSSRWLLVHLQPLPALRQLSFGRDGRGSCGVPVVWYLEENLATTRLGRIVRSKQYGPRWPKRERSVGIGVFLPRRGKSFFFPNAICSHSFPNRTNITEHVEDAEQILHVVISTASEVSLLESYSEVSHTSFRRGISKYPSFQP